MFAVSGGIRRRHDDVCVARTRSSPVVVETRHRRLALTSCSVRATSSAVTCVSSVSPIKEGLTKRVESRRTLPAPMTSVIARDKIVADSIP